MEKRRALISIDHGKCAPCPGLICVGVCPQGILETGSDLKPRVTDVASCTQCGVCANLCPSNAIIISRKGQAKKK